METLVAWEKFKGENFIMIEYFKGKKFNLEKLMDALRVSI